MPRRRRCSRSSAAAACRRVPLRRCRTCCASGRARAGWASPRCPPISPPPWPRRASAWAFSTRTCGATRSRGCTALAPPARRCPRSARSFPWVHTALTQFLQDVDWGVLDYLLIDLPPGTGDVSMTLAQLLPQAQFVIVTTPQATAQKVARRAAQMAHKVSLEIGGVIENMSGFTTPSGERFAIFGEGGGKELADELDVPLLGRVPLTMPLREHADSGVPLLIEDPQDPASQAIHQVARGLIAMAPLELPVLPLVEVGASPPAPTESRKPVGMSLPMA